MKDTDVVVPAFLRVMQAEQALMSNFAYEDAYVDERTVASFHKKLRGAPDGVTKPCQDEGSEIDGENETSIP